MSFSDYNLVSPLCIEVGGEFLRNYATDLKDEDAKKAIDSASKAVSKGGLPVPSTLFLFPTRIALSKPLLLSVLRSLSISGLMMVLCALFFTSLSLLA
jgi:hypothetical protein